MKDHKMKLETLKLLQEIISTDVKKDFLNRSLICSEIKGSDDQLSE